MFAIENSSTRKSLKSVFDNIFAKYGRTFEKDDEIDLQSMEVSQTGGHLSRIKEIKFGSVFKHSRKYEFESDSSSSEDEPSIDDVDLGIIELPLNVDDIFQQEKERIEPQLVQQIQSKFHRAIASSQEVPLPKKESLKDIKTTTTKEIVEEERGGPITFDSVLYSFIRKEREQIAGKEAGERCTRESCFDCTFKKEIFLLK